MNHLSSYESWQNSPVLKNTHDRTNIFGNTIKCDVCKELFDLPEGEKAYSPYVCDKCEEEGWYIDPAGGLHKDEDGDDDLASAYENWHDSKKLSNVEDVTGIFNDTRIEVPCAGCKEKFKVEPEEVENTDYLCHQCYRDGYYISGGIVYTPNGEDPDELDNRNSDMNDPNNVFEKMYYDFYNETP